MKFGVGMSERKEQQDGEIWAKNADNFVIGPLRIVRLSRTAGYGQAAGRCGFGRFTTDDTGDTAPEESIA